MPENQNTEAIQPDDEHTEDGSELLQTFDITVARSFEADFPLQEIQQAMAQTGTDSPEEAIRVLLAREEQQNVSPTEKLTGVHVQVDEVE